MPDSLPTDARSLLSAAAILFDSSTDLSKHASRAWRGGFRSGAAWMRRALELLRDQPMPARAGAFQWFGCIKYGLAAAISLGFAAITLRAGRSGLSLGSVVVFYAIEAQFVFLFPLLLDDSGYPIRDSLRWTQRAGGTLIVMRTVMRLALTMLGGGFFGAGFIRSWAVGCLAVCIWYERIRASPECWRRSRLSLGTSGPLQVRVENLTGWNLPRTLRVLYVSDLHLGRPWTGGAAIQTARAARAARPDLILLGGDLLDHINGAPLLYRFVRLLKRLSPVYAVAGNHDHRARLDMVREALALAGATWLTEPILIQGWDVALVSSPNHAPPACRTILCAHDPSIFPAAARAATDLVFAGHLHGGQCVLFQRNTKLYPGAWFARWTGLRFRHGRSTMLVSRGAADTLPVRWNCPREVILCEIS